MLLATVEALANLRPIRSVDSPASEGRSNCSMTFSTAARLSFELAVMINEFEYGSLVMRTLP